MLDIYNQQQIEKISLEILRRSKALDVFPTPIDKIVTQADLVISNNIDLSKVKHSFFERVSEGAKSTFKEIRGILDRKQRTIYLDLSVGESRKNFVKLHETGHDLMSWQQAILNCLDDDETLSLDYKEQFEVEANFFASLTLFQHDRFDDQMKKLQLGIAAAKVLSKTFGASVHATLRRYVERTTKRCALIVLEKPIMFPVFSCRIRNYFQSTAFTKAFGTLKWEEELAIDNELSFIDEYSHGKRYSEDGEITLQTDNESIDLNYHFFNNTYNAFVLMFPNGENKPTRTKIIVSAAEV